MKRQFGFTLYEVIICLALMSVLTSLAASGYIVLKSQVDAEDTLIKVDEIFLSINEFYWRNCRSSSLNPQPSITALVNSGLMIDRERFYSAVSDSYFETAINWTSPAMLQISLTISGRGGAVSWKDTLNVTSVIGDKLIWHKPAGQLSDPIAELGREYLAMYEPASSCSY